MAAICVIKTAKITPVTHLCTWSVVNLTAKGPNRRARRQLLIDQPGGSES